MLTVTILFATGLYVIGVRADRIHAERAVTETGRRHVSVTYASSLVSRSVSVTASRGLYRGRTAAYWAHRYRTRTRQYQQARRVLYARPTVTEAIELAATVYGNRGWLWRVARCESGLNPGAQNASGSTGLMQFMPGTFRSTPFGRLSIWSPYASAMAAGWMASRGRASEWVCG